MAVGDGITVAPGTPGVVYLMDFCGRCRSCLVGATNQCLAKRADMDLVIDTTRKQAARQAALGLLAKRGVFVCVGHGEGFTVDVSADLIAPERALLGSEYFRYDELPANLEMLRTDHAFLGQIITHRFPIGEISQAFATFVWVRAARSSWSSERRRYHRLLPSTQASRRLLGRAEPRRDRAFETR